MSDAIPAAGVTPATSSASVDIGLSPLAVTALSLLGVGLGGILFGFLLVAMGQQGGVIVDLILVFPWLLFLAWLGIRLLVLLATGGGLAYRRTKAAVAAGRIGVSYFFKGHDHVIVVDEPRRLVCVNGEVFGFGDVKRLNMQSQERRHRLTISLASGADPIKVADLRSESDLRVAFQRVGNSLGLD